MSLSMMIEDFYNNLAEALNNPDLSIQKDTRLADIPYWDSLAILTTISMVDIKYGVTISGTELQNCETVFDLYRIVTERKGTVL